MNPNDHGSARTVSALDLWGALVTIPGMSGGAPTIKPNRDAEPVSPSSRWDILLSGGIIAFAALVAYHNCFTVPFILDDVPSVIENPKIRHLWPIGDALSPSKVSLVGGRPLVNLSFTLNYALGAWNVWGYHALNLAIHVLAGLTLFGIVRRTLLLPSLRERFSPSAVRLALAVAVLWTVHPLQTEAVTYISQRCESLMGLFYLQTLYCFVRGVDSRRCSGWFMLSIGACLLGMATKEVMVTAPLMVLLYDRTFVSGSFRDAWTQHRRLYLALASTWLLLGWLMVGLHYRGVGYGYGIPWWASALTESRAVVHYLSLALWPHPLVFDYGDDVTIWHAWHVADVVPYALIAAVLGVAVLLEFRRQPSLGFVGVWFFLILAPVSSVVPVAGQPMAEHRMYLPLAAVVALGVLAIDTLLGRRSGAVFLALAVGLGSLAIRRNQDYRSELSIWTDTLAKCPDNARAHYNLGSLLYQQGETPEAIAHFERALRISSDYAEAHYNLGLALARLGRLSEAVGQWEQAVRIKPDYAEAHNNLAAALPRLSRLPEAVQHGEQALRIHPDDPEAHNNLGVVLAQLGRMQEAVGHWEQALRIKSDYAEAHVNWALALVKMGRPNDAIRHYEEALRLRPDDVQTHYNLGIALEKAGRVPEALQHYEQALRLRPDLTAARNALARLQGNQ